MKNNTARRDPGPRFKEHPGRVMRGFRFRLYTSTAQDQQLRDIEEKMKRCWNWLCARAQDVTDARAAYAERYHGIVSPERLADGAPPIDWATYRAMLAEWRADVRRVCKGVDAVRYRSIKDWMQHFGVTQDYQLFPRACDVTLPCVLLRALCKDYQSALCATVRGQRPPQFKRRLSHVTLRTRQGKCFRLRAAGPRPGKLPGSQQGRADWLNCEVQLPGIGWLPGHIGGEQLPRLEADEYWVEGVSVVEETDGWYAAIRQWVVPRPQQDTQSPDSRWRGYGMSAGKDEGTPRSNDWEIVPYERGAVLLRDVYPDGIPDDPDGVLAQHRWRVSIRKPNGVRVNPRKACPYRESAWIWASSYVHALIAAQAWDDTAALTTSPVSRGDVLGIDSGLVHLVTIAGECDVLHSGNSRNGELLERIAGRQAEGMPVGKLQTQAARRVKHLLRGVEAWIREAQPRAVAVEDGGKQDEIDAGPAESIAVYIAQDGHGRKRKEGGYTPSAGWLLAQIADLTREVERYRTSKDCSRCGNGGHTKARTFLCSAGCEPIDRDLNAARNLRQKLLKLLASEEAG